MLPSHKPVYLHACLAVALHWLPASPLPADVTASFAEGEGKTEVDQFPGKAGLGWTTGWQRTEIPGQPAAAIKVPDQSPDGSPGRHLSITATATGDNAIGRAFDATGEKDGVNVNLPHTMTFDVRIESLDKWNHAMDYITIHATRTPGQMNSSPGSSFIIRAAALAPAPNMKHGEWMFYDGARDGGVYFPSRFVNSGMPVVPGTTYYFTIRQNPEEKSYSVTIYDGTHTVSRNDLGWRSSLPSNHLCFNHRVSHAGDSIRYALDNIFIVP